MQTAQVIINLNHLRYNVEVLKAKCPNSKAVVVIKANAYGHDAVRVAKALPDTEAFAVARIGEAVALRKAGIKQSIILLEGCFCSDELNVAAEMGFTTLVHNQQQLEALELASLACALSVWVKVDTGMHRIGITPEQVETYHHRLEKCPNVRDDIGFVSHFSSADDLNSSMTPEQIECFEQATSSFTGPKSLSNSAGILYWPGAHYDWVRPGIALYGISPRVESCGSEEGLKPVMTLKSRLIAVRQHKAGDSVGYGRGWYAKQDTTIGVVAMGYGDGYPRAAPNGTPVIVNGRRVPLVGRVSMDMMTVDLGHNADDCIGDSVELFGDNLPVEEVSRHVGTIAYELVIKLTQRVTKTFIDEKPAS